MEASNSCGDDLKYSSEGKDVIAEHETNIATTSAIRYSDNENLIRDDEDELILKESDKIASKITIILVEAFKARENRDPTNDEILEMLEELTEDRITKLLEGKDNLSDDGIDEDKDNQDLNEEDGTSDVLITLENKSPSTSHNENDTNFANFTPGNSTGTPKRKREDLSYEEENCNKDLAQLL
eukprot:gene15798-21395_t